MHHQWNKYQGAILLQKLPYEEISVSYTEVQNAIKDNHAILARWTSEFDLQEPTEWWYCINDKFTALENLSAKQRYRVKKGIGNCNIFITQELSDKIIDDIYKLLLESFADYPEAYRPKINLDSTKKWLKELANDKNIDFWLTYNHDQKLIGYGYCELEKDIVWLRQIKVPTKYLGTEVNAALAYRICEHYLYLKKYRFICDGERNIKHMTNYQDFLVRVLNFRYAYCKLNIVYSWWMRIAVFMLYPVRSLIKRLGKNNPFFYNAYCILKQEEIRKSFI